MKPTLDRNNRELLDLVTAQGVLLNAVMVALSLDDKIVLNDAGNFRIDTEHVEKYGQVKYDFLQRLNQFTAGREVLKGLFATKTPL